LVANALKQVENIPDDWRECPQCGLISTLPQMRPELTADCPRCHHVLWRMRSCNFELPLACALAGALFFFYAVIAPFIEISSHGQFQLARLETGPYQLAQQGFDTVGLLVLGVSVILPGAKLAIILVTLTGLETHLLPKGILRDIFRWYEPIKPWAMVDVYLLGFLVAYTRLAVIATVHLDTALFALIGLVLSTAAANAFLDTEAVWRALDSAVPESRYCTPGELDEHLLIGCPSCAIVNHAMPGDRCRRCDAMLEPRKPASFLRSWAFIAAAAILYVPANVYPVMTISNLVQSKDFTIMGGIFELFQRGLWPLGLLVFFASILIPVVKLLTLATMLIETHLQSEQHLVGRTMSFRVVDFIGRWSMIDVFMISILVAVVRFGKFSSVQVQTGAPCFAAVVVLTMFAVNAFDPRLMWDRAEAHHNRLAAQPATGQA